VHHEKPQMRGLMTTFLYVLYVYVAPHLELPTRAREK
jgi:hypothetical protein